MEIPSLAVNSNFEIIQKIVVNSKMSKKLNQVAIKPLGEGGEPEGVDGEGERVSGKACGEKCKGVLRIIFLNL